MAMQNVQSSNQQLWENLYVKGARWCDIDDADDATDYDSGNESSSCFSTGSQFTHERSTRTEPDEEIPSSHSTHQAVPCPPMWSAPTMMCWTPQVFWHQPAPAPVLPMPVTPPARKTSKAKDLQAL